MNAQESKKLIIPYINASLDDQRFVLNFIMSVFIGPDVINDIPRQSASRRMAEGFPPYSLSDLGSSFVSFSQLESLYYYICRYAHPSLVLKPCLLHMYLNGNLPNSGILEDTKQFTSFYPLDLHAQPVYQTSFRIFMGIILIDKPNVSHVEPYDFERFRKLSCLPYSYLEFLIENFKLFHHDPWAVKEQMNLTNVITDGILNEYAAPLSPGNCQNQQKKRCHIEPLQRMHPHSSRPVENFGSTASEGIRGRKRKRVIESLATAPLPTVPLPFPSPVNNDPNTSFYEEMVRELLSDIEEGNKMCVNESLSTAPPTLPSPVVSKRGSPVVSKRGRKKRCVNESLTTVPPPFPSPVVSHSQEKKMIQQMSASAHVLPRPSFIILTSNPVSGAENPNISFALTGSAKEGGYGPPLGVVDMGTSRRAYIIRMALPGLQNNRDQLYCDIEIDGQVNLTGTTRMGESVVSRNSRVFKMMTNHLSPPGQFKVSFKLPGPVDPRVCSFSSRPDGILEIVVGRFKKPRAKYTKKKDLKPSGTFELI